VAAEVASGREREADPAGLDGGEVRIRVEAEAPHLGLAVLVCAQCDALLLPLVGRHGA